MKLIAPDYYNDFHCIANRCTHSCCIGWEIDIDCDTLEFYSSIDGDFGRRLRDNICFDDTPHFKLKKDDCCPFLNENGLCDIIINLGQNSLCQICDDHPRFRNFYENRIEIGLGLCCEEVARLILSRENKTALCVLEDDKSTEIEQEFFSFRERIFGILQDRSQRFEQRIAQLLKSKNITLKTPNLEFWRSLERLDSSWDNVLGLLENADLSCDLPKEWDTPFEQLAVYFAYRHLSPNTHTGEISFIAHACNLISDICKAHLITHSELKFADFINYARMFSSEIEYSNENLDMCFCL